MDFFCFFLNYSKTVKYKQAGFASLHDKEEIVNSGAGGDSVSQNDSVVDAKQIDSVESLSSQLNTISVSKRKEDTTESLVCVKSGAPFVDLDKKIRAIKKKVMFSDLLALTAHDELTVIIGNK